MKAYEVDYAAKIDVYGTYPVNAVNKKQAEDIGLELVAEEYPNYKNIEIEEVREITV